MRGYIIQYNTTTVHTLAHRDQMELFQNSPMNPMFLHTVGLEKPDPFTQMGLISALRGLDPGFIRLFSIQEIKRG